MVELFILVMGLIITGLLALLKVAFAITVLTAFWIWLPTMLAALLVFGLWFDDFT